MILLPIFVSVTNKTKFMPEICRFFGIIIFLYWKDHNPPHIHFTYGDYECSISVLDRMAQFENLGELVKSTIFVA